MVGDRITIFVVPTLMIFALDASALEVGIVSMAQYLGIPLLGPVAGVLVDRWDKRRTLIGCDLVRLVAVLAIPVAYWLDALSTPLLFVCVAAISGATIFFSVGYLVAVPAAVHEEDGLVRAYSRLEGSRTVAEVAGPSDRRRALPRARRGLAGRGRGELPGLRVVLPAACRRGASGPTDHGPIRKRLALGFQLNWADPVLRRVVVAAVTLNSGGPIFVTVLPILAYRGLGLSAGAFGLAMSAAALGGVLGAVVAPRIGAPVRARPDAGLRRCCCTTSSASASWRRRPCRAAPVIGGDPRLLRLLHGLHQRVQRPDPAVADERGEPGHHARRVPHRDVGRDPARRARRRPDGQRPQPEPRRPRRGPRHHGRRHPARGAAPSSPPSASSRCWTEAAAEKAEPAEVAA